MACPNCGVRDPGPGPFCMSCGYKLPDQATATETPSRVPPMVGAAPVEGRVQPATAAPPTEHRLQPPRAAIGQMGSAGTMGLSIWGPFAGYGVRGRHVSWLISDQGEQAERLLDAFRSRFKERGIPNVITASTLLMRRGILVDTRPYTLVKRKLATAGLYIARFGKDLYVSQVTYYKGPISNVRILAVALMGLFYLIYPVIYGMALSGVDFNIMTGVAGLQNLAFAACCLGPLYLVDAIGLTVLAVFSVYKWLMEKDLLSALREPPNEFDIDDIVALEKSVEQTVRECLDMVGIEQRLMPPAGEYGMRRRLF